jgi:multicomponent Na+:H+ antiporter subunit C
VTGSTVDLFLLVGAALFALGAAGVFREVEALRRIIAVNVMGSGVFLVLVAIAARGEGPPDPVPHAMVLTGIVVAVCATAVALALADLSRRHGSSADDKADR